MDDVRLAAELEATGQIGQLEKTVGQDGKGRAARQPLGTSTMNGKPNATALAARLRELKTLSRISYQQLASAIGVSKPSAIADCRQGPRRARGNCGISAVGKNRRPRRDCPHAGRSPGAAGARLRLPGALSAHAARIGVAQIRRLDAVGVMENFSISLKLMPRSFSFGVARRHGSAAAPRASDDVGDLTDQSGNDAKQKTTT
jgi:hypothetical protein